MADRGEIEAREMIELEPFGVGQHRFEMGRGIIAAGVEAHQMLVAAAIGDLDDTQSITRGDQPHRLGVDRDRAGAEHAGGQVFFVEMDRSEEHTSELQSLMRISYAVFCLKKKKE